MTKKAKAQVVKLAEPVNFNGAQITEITIRRPKVKDLRRIDDQMKDEMTELDQGAVMASALTGQPVEFFDELDFEDFVEVQEVVADFFPKGSAEETGEPSLPKLPTG
jgi:hypothetical protein